jgi:energy-coupling factor transport system permease protein
MLKDITLGQYFPTNSIVHRLDSRIKIISVLVFIIAVFICDSAFGFLLAVLFTLSCVFASKISLATVLKSLKPVFILIIFTAIINLLFTGGDTYVFEWKFIKITENGLYSALKMTVRIILLVSFTSLLTFTTSPIALTDGLEVLLKPFSKIGLPSHELAMMMTIALRFIPTLLEETDKIIMAQKSRGADFETGSIVKRAKSLIPIMVPLFINSFRRADELATAMECRCYRGGKGRTKLKELKITLKDTIAFILVLIVSAVTIIIGA